MTVRFNWQHVSARWPLLIALTLALAWQNANAQAPALLPSSDCPAPDAILPPHLFGRWQLTLGPPDNPSDAGQLTFKPHPEFSDSVRGTLNRNAQGHTNEAQVAGDVTDQGFQLEESADGVTIDAVWSGDVTPTSCGREIRGWRRVTEGNSTQEAVAEQPFLLKKTPGWQ